MEKSICEIKNILINDLSSPLGITSERAVISWKTVSDRDGFLQQAYRVTVSDGDAVTWDAMLMSEMAEIIGKTEDAERYRRIYEEEKEFFISLYVNEDGTFKRGEQTLCLYALHLDLLPDERSVKAVTEQLVSNIRRNGDRLQTGFLGTAIFLPTLTEIGLDDIAYTLLLQHENPSWLYSVDQGATTIWERWNSYTKDRGFGNVGTNSFNHYAYGAVAFWMFETMAGIAPAEPGFKKIKIAPRPDKRLEVKAEYESAYGLITSESRFADGIWKYSFLDPI